MPKALRVVKRFENASAAALAQAAAGQLPSRRIFSMVAFGFEMAMLRLHMETLSPIVAAFLVSESRRRFQTKKEKPAVLTDAIAAQLA